MWGRGGGVKEGRKEESYRSNSFDFGATFSFSFSSTTGGVSEAFEGLLSDSGTETGEAFGLFYFF